MIRVSMVSEYNTYTIFDKKGVGRQIKIFKSNDNIYLGPVQTLFDRTYVMKDKHRMNFVSKLDNKQNELMHVRVVLDKIREYGCYSYYTEDGIVNFLKGLGYTEDDMSLKPKIYSTSKEMFIEYGFNSMNFCLDRRGDIWVHYKAYEEKKQYREILNNINNSVLRDEFEKMYRKIFRFVRYINMDDENNVKCFALKSINITKLYFWLKDHGLIHKINYVGDIYNETLRELEFHNVSSEDNYTKVIIDSEGVRLKNNLDINNENSDYNIGSIVC